MNGQLEQNTPQTEHKYLALIVLGVVIICFLLASCGGGANGERVIRTFTETEAAAMTPEVAASLIDKEVIALGTKIKFLSNRALSQFTAKTDFSNSGQMQSISAEQIQVLTPEQVRYLGSTGFGLTMISGINTLSASAWAALVSNPKQVAAITALEMPTILEVKIPAFGENFKYLSNDALSSLTVQTNFGHAGQVQTITATEFASLSPAQARLLAINYSADGKTVSRIFNLNAGAWGALVSDPLHVAAITVKEIQTIKSSKIAEFGVNFKYLTNEVLSALTYTPSGLFHGQIPALTSVELNSLSPEQRALIGKSGN